MVKCSKKSTCEKKLSAEACASSSRAATTISADIDVGFGNQLYIRGEGNGLSWDKGIAMKNEKNKWTWKAAKCDKNFEYKLLINDEIWSAGDNFLAVAHEKNEVKPQFEA